MKPVLLFVTLIVLAMAGCATSGTTVSGTTVSGTTVKLQPRADVTQKYLWLTAEQAHANVVLFAGGTGRLDLSASGAINNGENNFLVRSRNLFLAQGFNIALFDAPSDQQGHRGMRDGFRQTSKHSTDIAAVIRDIQHKSNLPVWLIGTSRGTESVATAGIDHSDMIHGVVFTATVTAANDQGTELPALELDKITVPVLIASHKHDACWVTPPEGAEEVKAALTKAPEVQVAYFEGGSKAESKPCNAKTPHGFFGIESQVVAAITEFINANTAKQVAKIGQQASGNLQ